MIMTFRELEVRAATDAAFRADLLRDPEGALAREGLTLPEGVSLAQVIEAANGQLHPDASSQELADDQLDSVAGGLGPVGGMGGQYLSNPA
jgi:hypothetical protein